MSDTTTLRIPAHIAADLSEVRQPAAAAPTLPPAVYSSDEIYDAESEWIFGSGWMGLGRGDRWPNPGDYIALDLAGDVEAMELGLTPEAAPRGDREDTGTLADGFTDQLAGDLDVRVEDEDALETRPSLDDAGPRHGSSAVTRRSSSAALE